MDYPFPLAAFFHSSLNDFSMGSNGIICFVLALFKRCIQRDVLKPHALLTKEVIPSMTRDTLHGSVGQCRAIIQLFMEIWTFSL